MKKIVDEIKNKYFFKKFLLSFERSDSIFELNHSAPFKTGRSIIWKEKNELTRNEQNEEMHECSESPWPVSVSFVLINVPFRLGYFYLFSFGLLAG